MNLDPLLFNSPVSPQERTAFVQKFYPEHRTAKSTIVGGLVVAGVAFVGLLLGALVPDAFAVIFAVALFAFVTSFFVIVFRIFAEIDFNIRTETSIKAYRFATANNLDFLPEITSPSRSGFIFSNPNARAPAIRDSIINTNEYPFEIGNYYYMIGSGKNQTERRIGFMRITLDRKLPHMVLDTTADDTKFLGFLQSNLGMSFTKDQAMRLEGNFNDYFTLYAPKEYETDALYVFTPDLMARLIDNSHAFNAEIVDDNLYIYSTDYMHLDRAETYEKLFGIFNTVGSKALKQTRNYTDTRSEVRGEVATQGRRLNKRSSLAIGSVILLVYLAYSMPVIGHSIEQILNKIFW